MTKIHILGTGCTKCQKLADATKQAADNLGLDYEMEKVTDINQIMAFGVMSTPALVVNGAVVLVGKVPAVEAIEKLLR